MGSVGGVGSESGDGDDGCDPPVDNCLLSLCPLIKWMNKAR